MLHIIKKAVADTSMW